MNGEAVLFGGTGKLFTDRTVISSELEMLYDLVVSSMDWGSGMLETSEMEAVAKLGILCGFDVPECGAHYTGPNERTSQLRVYVRDCHKPLTHAGSHEGTRVTTRFLGRVEHYSTIFKETIEIEQWSPGAEEPFTWEV